MRHDASFPARVHPETVDVADASGPADAAGAPVHVRRLRGALRIDEAGVTVAVRFRAPAGDVGTPQGVFSHAQDAVGWWVGLGADGRAAVGVGTSSGPVGIAVGSPVPAASAVWLVARIPGRPGDRLSIEARVDEDDPVSAAVVLGAPVLAGPGPLLWGCRSLIDETVPVHPFAGTVEETYIVADAAAPADPAALRHAPRLVAVWRMDDDAGESSP